MEKFKIDDKLIAYDDSYWGPRYNNTDVVVVSQQHPMYTVQCFDQICRSVHYDKLITPGDFYNMKDIDTSPEGDATGVPDVPDLPKCTCEMLSLLRYGCKCGGI